MIDICNQQLFFFINGYAGVYPIADHFFLFVTHGVVPALVGGALVWFFFVLPRRVPDGRERLRRYRDAGLLVLSLSLVWCITEIMKGAVAFPRPQQLLQGVHVLSTFGSYDSFPSAHTAFAFTIASFIFHYSRRAGWLVGVCAVLVGVSRVFVGVHFPLDVVVGACIGIVVPWGLHSLLRRYTF